MKHNKLITTNALIVMLIMIFSCEDFLDMPSEASTTQEEIFSSYESFQGFQDVMYSNLIDFHDSGNLSTANLGGEEMGIRPLHTSTVANKGNYLQLISARSVFWAYKEYPGIWEASWPTIRIANLCLQKLDEDVLIDATEEQRNWLRGQALFFRAYYHYELVRAWGTIPYIDEVLDASNQNMKRHWSYEKDGKTYNDVQAVLERVAEDMDAAANLLPAVWPDANKNYGRATKIAALGFKSKALLFSASPLFNEQATGELAYNKELLLRSAKAAKETIDLAIANLNNIPEGMVMPNVNGLTPLDNYIDMFATKVGNRPTTSEVLFSKYGFGFHQKILQTTIGRIYGVKELANQDGVHPTQMYVDKYELKTGERYNPTIHDHDASVRFNKKNLDARYDKTFWVHNEKLGKVTTDFSELGANFKSEQMMNAFGIRKYFPDGLDKFNKEWNSYGFSTPLLRLADIYLGYAEAIYEATGSYNATPSGFSMTPEQAVNIVRSRAAQPNVATTLTYYNYTQPQSCELESDDPFRKLYRNERSVEFGYEGVYWFDIRRWKRAHLKNGTDLQALYFKTKSKKDLTVDENTVRRDKMGTFTFLDRQYWLPFEPSFTQFTTDWEQNAGW